MGGALEFEYLHVQHGDNRKKTTCIYDELISCVLVHEEIRDNGNVKQLINL